MAFTRMKQIYAPEVEELIKELTGFEDNERNFEEVSKYFYQNIIHHNFATADFSSVQRSLEGIVEKFKLHGLKGRGQRLQELIERYVSSSLSEHAELQWNVLLLLLRLSYKPTRVPEESLKTAKQVRKCSDVEKEEKINWNEYLKEGWEIFECPNEDSDIWSEEENENDEEKEPVKHSTDKHHRSVSPLPSYKGVPHPSLWRPQSPPLTQRESIRAVLRDALKSEQRLRSHVQHSWWADHACRSLPESKQLTAHTCEIWERSKQKNQTDVTTLPLRVISEYKVLQEVLWMLQIPTNTSLFCLDDQGHFCMKPSVSLPTSLPDTLYLSLKSLCPYFNMLHELKEFQETLNSLEQSDCPAPFTFQAYCAELCHQLQGFNTAVVAIETRFNKQEETMTLLSVENELTPQLKKLRYLYDIHTRGTKGWQGEPPWLQVTRLLSVLYETFLEANDHSSLEATLSLFINSFHVYLDIIDIWLSEGRLEDWREEFLVIRKNDSFEVMPYEQEMHKRGVVPVALLTKLVKVVKDAGYTLEVVSNLNKLTDLRDTVQNKGCLYKEFSENVNTELNRLKRVMNKIPIEKEEHIINTLEDVSETEVDEIRACEENTSNGSNTGLKKTCKMISAGDTVLREYKRFVTSEDTIEVRKEDGVSPPRHLSVVTTEALYDRTVKTFLSNTLLAEALKDYFQSDESDQPLKSEPKRGLQLDSITLMGVACLHRVLEKQVELVETRHRIASRLVTQTLCGECNLLQHLTVVRNVFFMESGILAQRFYSFLFKEVESGLWRNHVNLTMHLQDCVEELFPGFHSCFSVHINRTQATNLVQQAIQAISVAYMVEWPISLVITDDAINSYNKVFRFLLCIKYAFWVLQDIRFSELSNSPNLRRVKRLQALKMWMYHSTNTLHSYFMGLVLRCYSDHLDESVQHATSLQEIIDAHKKYLIEVISHCLQLKKSYLETFIMKLVWQCRDLSDLWMLEASGNLKDDDVRELEQQYLGAYMGLTHCLEAITSEVDDEVNPLWELKAEFLNSVPEVWQDGGSL